MSTLRSYSTQKPANRWALASSAKILLRLSVKKQVCGFPLLLPPAKPQFARMGGDGI